MKKLKILMSVFSASLILWAATAASAADDLKDVRNPGAASLEFADAAIGSVPHKRSYLTEQEITWLQQHPVIRVHNEKDWPPFNYFEYGTPRGLSIDYMNLLAEKLGIKVEYITGPSWNEFLEMAKRKELDVMLDIVKTEDRMKYLLYTEPYIRNPNAIVSSTKSPYEKVEALFGKTVAFPKGFFYEEVLTKSFPQIQRLPVEDTLASLKAVTFGKADAALGEEAVFRTLISKNMLTGLQISGEVNIGNPDLVNLRLGVRNDWPLLHTALMKAMAAITPQEMNQIRQKWMPRVSDEKVRIQLTDAERKWLAENRDISLGVDPAWPPFEFIDKSGHYAGIGSSIIEAISDRLDIEMTHIPGLTWSQVIEKAKAGEIDVLPALMRTPDREKYLNFTKPYLSFPIVTATNKNIPFIGSIKDLEGYRVGVVKDYYTEDILRHDHPYLEFVTYTTLEEALRELDAGRLDAFVDNMITISHEIARSGLENTIISASTEYTFEVSLGVRKDLPELVGILNKVLDDISSQEKAAIKSTWMSDVEVKIRFDFKAILAWAIPIGGSAFLILAFVVIWNRKLGQEITERKRTEAQLESAEERSRLLLESAGEGIFGVDREGKVAFINPAANRMLGYGTGELVGQDVHEQIHHSRTDGSSYPKEECPMFLSHVHGTDHHVTDEALWRKDGTQFLVEYRSMPIKKDGRVVGVVITFMDITERKKIETTLLAERERLQKILDTSPVGVGISTEGVVRFANPRFTELFDLKEGQSSIDTYANPEDRNYVLNELEKSGIVRDYELQTQGRNLEIRNTLATFISTEYEGKKGILAWLVDITGSKKAEQELKARFDELDRFRRLAIGREQKMIELKNEINELLKASGLAEKYKIH